MKLTSPGVAPFLAKFIAAPDPALRALLVYGPDGGLVRERADAVARAVVPDLRDPFRVADMTAQALGSDPARLADEVQSMSLTGGRRVVRVRDAGDGAAALFDRFFKALPPGDGTVVVEAGDLAARSSLRRAFENAKGGVAIPCYADGPRELGELVRGVFASHGIATTPEATQYLVASLGGDRAMSRQELEKLALYVGDGGKLSYDDAVLMVGDTAALTVDDVIYAAGDGDAPGLERALFRAFQEGEASVSIIRATMRHFQRLHLVGARMEAGAGDDEAMQRLYPQVFFKLKDRFRGQLRLWPPRRAASVLEALLEAERNAKRTGIPDQLVCRDALLRIARGAQGAGARRARG